MAIAGETVKNSSVSNCTNGFYIKQIITAETTGIKSLREGNRSLLQKGRKLITTGLRAKIARHNLYKPMRRQIR